MADADRGAQRPRQDRPHGEAGNGPAKRGRPHHRRGRGGKAEAGPSHVDLLTPQASTPAESPRAVTPTVNGAGVSSTGFTTTRFTDFVASGLISQSTASGIAALTPPHIFCTEVQEATLPVILKGGDVLAQAKTGTGKSLAFTIPTVERMLAQPPQPGMISALIISPTRELAIQIEEVARVIVSSTSFGIQHVVGGTNMNSESKRLNSQRCDILVATPGRLLDHLQNGNMVAKLSQCRTLILDEADRLLEQGFRQDLVKIISYLPNRNAVPRQSLLFSATIPAQVHQIASMVLLPQHSFISTVSDEDQNTHERVPQFLVKASLDDSFAAALSVIDLQFAINKDETKIMAFFPTARATGLAAELFKKLNIGLPIWEIHSRKSQGARNQAAEAFKVTKGGILFSSDVTARGMDFPNVTCVLQVGLPASGEQYVHRLGRTARAGADGCGVLVLAPFEEFFLRKREISALPISLHPESAGALAAASPNMANARGRVRNAMALVDDESKAMHYAATIGFYKSSLKETFGTPANLVKTLNDYSLSPYGLAYTGANGEVPGLLAKTVGKMGLKGTPGLRIIKEHPGGAGGGPSQGGPQRGGFGGGQRGGGGGGPRGRGRGRPF